LSDRADEADDDVLDSQDITPKQSLQRHDARGRSLSFSRDGSKIHLHTDRIQIDRE
jgi:hypothetical protein